MNSTTAFRIAAVFGLAAVALGAFGAHWLRPLLEASGEDALRRWQTGSLYHLAHSVVLLFVAGREPLSVWAWRLFALGILIFSGTLYTMAITNITWLGAIAPIGGVCLIGGWLALAIRGR